MPAAVITAAFAVFAIANPSVSRFATKHPPVNTENLVFDDRTEKIRNINSE
jgi:hypothetical protein